MTTQNINVPALRFPEFNNQWNETSLSKFLIPTLREIDKPTKSYLAIGVRSHCKGTFQKLDSEPEKIAMEKLFVVKENDLIVNITFAWEGAIAIVKKEDEDGLVSHRFPTYTFNENVSSYKFFQYVFTQKKFRTTLELISPGGAGRNRVLSKKDFLKIKVNLPAVPEQQKIAAFLTVVDEKIQQLAKKKDFLGQYKKGLMQKVFNQEIRFKDDNGNDFADWEEKPLNNFLFEARKRNGELKYNKQQVLSVSGDAGIVNQIQHLGRSYAGVSVHNYHIVETGDIVYTKSPLKSNPYGIVKVNKGVAGIVSTLYAVYSCKENIIGEFVDYYFEIDDNTNKYLRPLVRKGAKNDMKINNAHVLTGLISIPSIPEQKKIIDFFEAMDRKINSVNQQLEKTQTYKKGLLQRMFV